MEVIGLGGVEVGEGLTLKLEGDCNDGFGKGLSGGKLALYPPKTASPVSRSGCR